MEKFDEIWLLHQAFVYNHQFWFLSLLLFEHGKTSFTTFASTIVLNALIIWGFLLRVWNSFVPFFVDDVLLQAFQFCFIVFGREDFILLHILSEDLLVPPGELIMFHFNNGTAVGIPLSFIVIAIIGRARLIILYLLLFPGIHCIHNGFSLLVDISFYLMRHLFSTAHLLYY